jgi:predicted AAA+ superfamily ATPase
MISNRAIYKQMLLYKDMYPILAVTGPRQSGKTTMLKTMFPEYVYLNLENPDTRQYAESDPNGFFREYNNKVILDEVQRTPHLFSYIQNIVDESGIMGQFILSGSQNFHLMQNITQSLAGRVILFKLLPFDFSELTDIGGLPDDYSELIIRGSYPALYDRNIPSKVFYANYVQTYIERDVTEVLNVRNTRQFRTFLLICATRAGQILNLNALANECGITQPTAKSWLSVLESSYVIFLLHPFHNNFSKRVIKSPKLYFYDTGLLAFLLKISDSSKLKLRSEKGALFENLIISEKAKQNYHQYLQQDHWFWRDSQGKEVDLIIQQTETFDVFELKATETVTTKLFEGLDYFKSLAQNLVSNSTLIYAGEAQQNRTNHKVRGWQNC